MKREEMQQAMENRARAEGKDLDGRSDCGECTCAELADNLLELLDEEIPAAQAARLKEHIRTCPSCQDLAAAEQHLRRILRASCTEAAPATLRVRIEQQITIYKSGRW